MDLNSAQAVKNQLDNSSMLQMVDIIQSGIECIENPILEAMNS